jgi:O-antigen/teichoic acid export membrane protein
MRGLSVGYVSQVVLALVGLWVTRFLLGELGQQQYGLWLVATQLVTYLALTDLGIVALLPREVAIATGKSASGPGDAPPPVVVGETVRIVLWQMPLVALAGLVVWTFLPADWESLRGPLGLLLAAYLLTFPLRVPPATLAGLQDHAFLGALNTGSLLAGTAVTVLLVLRGAGLLALVAGWAVTHVILGAGAFLRLRRRFPSALPRGLPALTAAAARRRFGRGLWVSASQVAVVLLNATDTVIIGSLLGAAAIVPYAVTAKLVQFLGSQPQLLMQTAQPGLAELRASAPRPRILQAATALTQAVLLTSGAIACGVVVVNYGFVRLWVGEAHWGGFGLTLLVIGRALLGHWNLAAGSAIFSFGYERRLALVGIADGALFVVLTSLLVSRLGIMGAPLAGIITVLGLQLTVNLSALARETGSTTARLVASLWPWAWRFALAFAAAVVLERAWRPTSLPALIAAGGLAVVGYGLLMIRRVQEPPLSLYLHPRLRELLRRLPRPLRAAEA